MDNVLFRCSRLGDLMTSGRKKDELLGQTSKSFIEETWLKNKYGYEETIMTDAMLKGHLCESESRVLIHQVLGGEMRLRNEERLNNDYVIGTPDVVLKKEDVVEDIKNSQNIRTYLKSEITKNYYWQAQGYMWLTGKKKYRLIYTLNPDPFEIVEEQKKRLFFKYNCDESNQDYIDFCSQIDKNQNIINSLSKKEKVKVFEIEYSLSDIEKLKNQVEEARKYYETLTL